MFSVPSLRRLGFYLARLGHCGLAVALVLVLTTVALASHEGMRAANEVQEANYRNIMDQYLYTHTGHNRGYSSGPQHDPARDNIKMIFESYGLPTVFETFTYQGSTNENVIATQVGTLYPNQEYIIGGHYDSANNPGADDNASGVALVLEAARILSKYDSDYTIRYIAFDAEEAGLIGSQRYVAAHPGAQILGMISTDMVAYDPNNLLKANVYGTTNSTPIKQTVAAAVTEYGGLIPTIRGSSSGSDHYPFEQAGYQACLLIEGTFNSANYHTQRDNFEQPGNLNFTFASKMTRSVVGWLVDQAGVHVFVAGDLNCDGVVNFDDINPFVLGLSDPAGYQVAYPNCNIMNGDVNGDGVFNFDDINPFVALLSSGLGE
ncbi:MAG: M20/M25/M40 family metallo-hydrolase [Planctomycetota bacterium]